MGWLRKRIDEWFDETDWPRDPALDVFRDAVWQLSLNGQTRGWLTSNIAAMRSFPGFREKRERMWYQVHWVDGVHERLEEDYGPEWHTVNELRAGYLLEHDPLTNTQARFDASPVDAGDHDRLWARLLHGVEPEERV